MKLMNLHNDPIMGQADRPAGHIGTGDPIFYFRSLGSCMEFLDLGFGLMQRASKEEFRFVEWKEVKDGSDDE